MRIGTQRHLLVTMLAATVLLPVGASSQVVRPAGVTAMPGDTVRVRTQGWLYTGRLARVTPDTIVVSFAPDSAIVPRPGVFGVDVQRGTRRSPTRIVLGAAVGLVSGALIGGYAGARLECGTSCSDDGYLAGVAGGVSGAGIGGVAGAITGGILGARRRYPRWVPAMLPGSS